MGPQHRGSYEQLVVSSDLIADKGKNSQNNLSQDLNICVILGQRFWYFSRLAEDFASNLIKNWCKQLKKIVNYPLYVYKMFLINISLKYENLPYKVFWISTM